MKKWYTTEDGIIPCHSSGSGVRRRTKSKGSEVSVLGLFKEKKHLKDQRPQDNITVF